MRSKNGAITIDFQKENKIFIVKKIRGFVDSEFVKTCHEHIIRFVIKSCQIHILLHYYVNIKGLHDKLISAK